MITRRDFIKGLGAMAAAVVMPKVEEPEELHVTFTEAEDVFRYTWNPETGEETLVTGAPLVERVDQLSWLDTEDGIESVMCRAVYVIRGLDDRLIVIGYADPDHWNDADYVDGVWGVLDAMAEGQARERLGLND